MPFLHLPLRSWNVFVGWICWWRQVTLGDSLKAHMETWTEVMYRERGTLEELRKSLEFETEAC